MRNLILAIHHVFYGYNNKYHETRGFLTGIVCNVISRLCNYGLNLYLQFYKLMGLYPSPLKESENTIIVSLTSFPKRIDKVWMVIDSIFHQKLRPSKIYLYLTNEEFPKGKSSLPKRLLNYEKLGLEICFRDYNLMPHNKYYYALQEHTNLHVITIDDDMYYHRNLISNLWDLHIQYPNCICANTINIITFDKKGNFMPYQKWHRPITPQKPSILNVGLGYNGILYPAHIFHSKDVFDAMLIRKLSLKADDLWLKIQEIRENIPITTGEHFCSGPSILGAQAISLMSSNCFENKNDQQWKDLCSYYKIDRNMLDKTS